VGPSGSGKSTILNLLAGFLPDEKGQILNGKITVFGDSPSEFRSTGKTSVIFQDSNLIPFYSVKENIELCKNLANDKNSIDAEDSKKLIDKVGLSGASNLLPRQLSGGMASRVSIARALYSKPSLILLDEPFSSLDIAIRKKLYNDFFSAITHEGRHLTSILVTHNLEEAIFLAEKIVVLSSKGSIKAFLSNEDSFPRKYDFYQVQEEKQELLKKLYECLDD